jgi:hypothetical protein
MTFHDACIIGQKLPFLLLFRFTDHKSQHLTTFAPQIYFLYVGLHPTHTIPRRVESLLF